MTAAEGTAADQEDVLHQCTLCRTPIENGRGHQTEGGEPLCSPCYFAIWGPPGAADLARAVEEQVAGGRARRKQTW